MLKNRIAYLLLLAAAFFFFLYFNGYLSLLLLIAALLLPFLSLAAALAASWGISFQAALSPFLAKKEEPVRIEVTVKSRNFLPVSAVRIFLDITNGYLGETEKQQYLFPLGSRGETLLDQGFSSQYCGRIHIAVRRAVVYDYFRIFALPKKPFCQADSFILPSGAGFAASPEDRSWEGMASPAQKFGELDISELSALRDFRDGDRLRDVHWKLSSKLDKIVVKEYERQQECRVFFVLERLAAGAKLLDAEAEAAGALSRRLTELCVRHKVFWRGIRGWESCSVDDETGYIPMMQQFLSADPAAYAAPKLPPLESGCFLLYLSIHPEEALCRECSLYQGQVQVVALGAEKDGGAFKNIFRKAGVPLVFFGADQEAETDETDE